MIVMVEGRPVEFRGVSRADDDLPRRKPWRARMMVAGREISLGYYATAAEAAAAYKAAKEGREREKGNAV